MSAEWIEEHINDMTKEELQELISLKNRRSAAGVGAFVVSLFPQYTLLTHPFFRNYQKNGIPARIGIAGLLVFPLCMSFLGSKPFSIKMQVFIEKLKQKYN
ncbi:hypothetical protein SteCoe_27965 [Stentor coeruleus]|uniref:Uncharacterized protein n=1 Tax=Stentor coeruleus TaxID=5963 RepID=A0A1R2B9D8_9CILI|nr:hypothetical protein SteCoe_27965 [Stentor coeruleus]